MRPDIVSRIVIFVLLWLTFGYAIYKGFCRAIWDDDPFGTRWGKALAVIVAPIVLLLDLVFVIILFVSPELHEKIWELLRRY